MKITEKDLISFLDSFAGDLEAEQIAMYKAIGHSGVKQFDSYEEFYLFNIHPFRSFMGAFIKTEVADNHDVEFLMLNSDFVENNFQKLIELKEGMACCADKSRTIMTRLIDFYTTGKKITFNYDAEYTYHLPKTIFTSHDDIVMFYKGLSSLFYGNNVAYLKALQTLFKAKAK